MVNVAKTHILLVIGILLVSIIKAKKALENKRLIIPLKLKLSQPGIFVSFMKNQEKLSAFFRYNWSNYI